MRTRLRRGRWLAGGAVAIAATVVAASALVGRGTSLPPIPPAGSTGASDATPVAGPVVYYEVLDARASVLVEQRLDGTTPTRRVAERPDAVSGRIWSVDPAGTIAVSSVIDGDVSHLAAIAIADGQPVWSIDLPAIDIGAAIWSADGRRLAAIARPIDAGQPEALVVDTRDGRVVRTAVPDDAAAQGFEGDDALVLRERIDESGGRPTWRFLRIDPASNVVAAIAAPSSVGPASTGNEDVDPGHDVAVTIGDAPQQQGASIEAWPLDGGRNRSIAAFRSVDCLALDPRGLGVAVAITGAIRFVAWDGSSSELWSGGDAIDDLAWSADGAYLAVVSGGPDATVTLVERGTARSLRLPSPGRSAETAVVRIVGGVPLPANALPATEPTASPSAAPAGDDIAAAPTIAGARVQRVNGRWQLQVNRLVATSSGAMRSASSMPAVDLGPAPAEPNSDPEVRVLPRPRSADVLIWVETADGSRTRGWLWNGAGAARVPALPPDWPTNATDVHWSPDGTRLAGTTDQNTTNGQVAERFVVAAIGGSRTSVFTEPPDYPLLEGWWSTTELRLGHAICMDGCTTRFEWSARFRIRDRRLVPLTTADRGHGAVDSVYPDGRGGLTISPANADPAHEIDVDWPIGGSGDGPSWVTSLDGERAIVVASETASETDLYRIDDPIGRAVKGRLTDPAPTLLGHLPPHLTGIRVTDDCRWAITTDRVGDVALQDLETGRSWALDGAAAFGWWPGAG